MHMTGAKEAPVYISARMGNIALELINYSLYKASTTHTRVSS